MAKLFKDYVNGVENDVIRVKFNEMGITDEDLIAALIRTANVVAEEAYWVGREEGVDIGYDRGYDAGRLDEQINELDRNQTEE